MNAASGKLAVGHSPMASLRRLVRQRDPVERCGLCAGTIPPAHSHLLELPQRRVACACEACAILFSRRDAARYRRVPRGAALLTDFVLPDELWESLHLPIGLAFFVRMTPDNRTRATYPSPAGATESLLPLETWRIVLERNPTLQEFEPDVEALLVNRLADARDYWRIGIDKCFELVGVIRSNWRGLSGGPETWNAVSKFFAALRP